MKSDHWNRNKKLPFSLTKYVGIKKLKNASIWNLTCIAHSDQGCYVLSRTL